MCKLQFISKKWIDSLSPFGLATLVFLATIMVGIIANATPSNWKREWPNTDFSLLTVPAEEIISGGVPKDGIPAINNPDIISVSDEIRLDDREPVMAVQVEGYWRAYPIRYLLWHEIVNDELGGLPIAVTYCPLCNSGVVFNRIVFNEPLTFGVSGLLRHSDMIMYDRETESWWQQAIGQGIAGQYANIELDVIPALMISWAEYKETAGENGELINQPNARRNYGYNPYVGYDTSKRPFLYMGENPPHGIHPLSRVVKVGDKAWPLDRLRQEEQFVENGYQFYWREGLSSPLDTGNLADGREIGSVQVKDADNGELVAHDILFAFAFHAFFPQGEWMLGN